MKIIQNVQNRSDIGTVVNGLIILGRPLKDEDKQRWIKDEMKSYGTIHEDHKRRRKELESRPAYSSEIGWGQDFEGIKDVILIGTMIRGGSNFKGAKNVLMIHTPISSGNNFNNAENVFYFDGIISGGMNFENVRGLYVANVSNMAHNPSLSKATTLVEYSSFLLLPQNLGQMLFSQQVLDYLRLNYPLSLKG